jgi:hypothetical protein
MVRVLWDGYAFTMAHMWDPVGEDFGLVILWTCLVGKPQCEWLLLIF